MKTHYAAFHQGLHCNVIMDVITVCNQICKPRVVYRCYCMALYHSQTRRPKGGGGGGGTLIFSYIHRLGFKILIFNIFLFFFFWGGGGGGGVSEK